MSYKTKGRLLDFFLFFFLFSSTHFCKGLGTGSSEHKHHFGRGSVRPKHESIANSHLNFA